MRIAQTWGDRTANPGGDAIAVPMASSKLQIIPDFENPHCVFHASVISGDETKVADLMRAHAEAHVQSKGSNWIASHVYFRERNTPDFVRRLYSIGVKRIDE
jgi:hypothetical protein